MKILFASTPATGHINPLLAIAHILRAEGHEISFLTGGVFRDRIEKSGAKFVSLQGAADVDGRNLLSVAPELKDIPPGLQWFQVAIERFFLDRLPAQHESLLQAVEESQADVVVGDDMYFGALPMLLGPRSKRPPIVLCGTSFLHLAREDGAPNFLGLPPATTDDQRNQYAGIAREFDQAVDQPALLRVNEILRSSGVGPLSTPLFHSVVELADAYLQLSVPRFEYPRQIPRSVHFVGAPPIIPGQAPLPPFAHELDGSRKVVLVTQGTVANHNFGLLIAPTLAALAHEPDVLAVATTGGRPVEAIPGAVPSNARVASFLPFEWLLPRVDVLVTNGGYGSVNQAMSFGVPLVTAGMTEDKADVNARVAWSGVGLNLATNEPTPEALRAAVRTVLDRPAYRMRASQMADEFARIDTRSEVPSIIKQAVVNHKLDLLSETMATGRARRAVRQR